ncbi:Gustatory receptor, partial [Cinara cedri]
MPNENTAIPVYLKDRNFVEYEQRLRPNTLIGVMAADPTDTGFNSKKRKGHKDFEIKDDRGMPVNYVRIKELEENIRKEIISDKNSLHRSITPVMMLAHFFALIPVQGINGQNTSSLV